MKILAGLIAVVLLAGCATTADKKQAESTLQKLEQFTMADLSAAIVIAEAWGDTVGAACYKAVREELAHVAALRARTQATGAVSAYETARVVSMRVRAGIAPKVHIACAPLILDADGTITGLGDLAR